MIKFNSRNYSTKTQAGIDNVIVEMPSEVTENTYCIELDDDGNPKYQFSIIGECDGIYNIQYFSAIDGFPTNISTKQKQDFIERKCIMFPDVNIGFASFKHFNTAS